MPELRSALREHYPDGRYRGAIFSSETQGDFLIWALPADLPVLMFTHAHVFGPEHWEACRDVKAGNPGWREFLARHRANLIVVEPDTHGELADQLRKDPEWVVVHDGPESPASGKARVIVARAEEAAVVRSPPLRFGEGGWGERSRRPRAEPQTSPPGPLPEAGRGRRPPRLAPLPGPGYRPADAPDRTRHPGRGPRPLRRRPGRRDRPWPVAVAVRLAVAPVLDGRGRHRGRRAVRPVHRADRRRACPRPGPAARRVGRAAGAGTGPAVRVRRRRDGRLAGRRGPVPDRPGTRRLLPGRRAGRGPVLPPLDDGPDQPSSARFWPGTPGSCWLRP